MSLAIPGVSICSFFATAIIGMWLAVFDAERWITMAYVFARILGDEVDIVSLGGLGVVLGAVLEQVSGYINRRKEKN